DGVGLAGAEAADFARDVHAVAHRHDLQLAADQAAGRRGEVDLRRTRSAGRGRRIDCGAGRLALPRGGRTGRERAGGSDGKQVVAMAHGHVEGSLLLVGRTLARTGFRMDEWCRVASTPTAAPAEFAGDGVAAQAEALRGFGATAAG